MSHTQIEQQLGRIMRPRSLIGPRVDILLEGIGAKPDEIDKLVMLSLADQRTVGIYAISTRIIDFTAVPIRSFYVLYSRKLRLDFPSSAQAKALADLEHNPG